MVRACIRAPTAQIVTRRRIATVAIENFPQYITNPFRNIRISNPKLDAVQKGKAMAATKKPNILIIWGDDIGTANLSIFTKGMMGYRTPNIDRVAHEGVLFTDSYGEQSCTAGRAAFSTGQSVFRTGLSKVGL